MTENIIETKVEENTEAQTPSTENIVVDNRIDISEFAKVELRVGKILDGEPVPKSKKLLKLKVDLGEEQPRQILSGISQFYQVDDLKDKHVIIVSNLKPATMMGLESQGMLLATQSKDGTSLHVLEVPTTFEPGSIVR